MITRHLEGFPDLPPVWFLAGWLLAETLARTAPLLRLEADWLDAVAALVALPGLALALWSALWFRTKRTRIEPRQTPSALIVEGPYRFSRNPIYLGLVLILLGLALRTGALSALLPALLLPVILQRRFIVGEEATLRGEFGADADAFLERTPRWLGRARRARERSLGASRYE
jgi:protein-S-isoprenylcysteine O-methyltransferase Ste14